MERAWRATDTVCSEAGDGWNPLTRGKRQSARRTFTRQLFYNISCPTDDPSDLRTYVGGSAGASGGSCRKWIADVESGAEEGMGTA
jgi:hypothetical protein